MSNHRRCKTCGEWGWFGEGALRFGAHKCAPIWEAHMHETKWQDDWSEVHANDAEEAASKFAEEYDRGGDYDIIRRGSAEIEVRKQGDETVTLVDVSAESVPQYRAYARTPQGTEDRK